MSHKTSLISSVNHVQLIFIFQLFAAAIMKSSYDFSSNAVGINMVHNSESRRNRSISHDINPTLSARLKDTHKHIHCYYSAIPGKIGLFVHQRHVRPTRTTLEYMCTHNVIIDQHLGLLHYVYDSVKTSSTCIVILV